MYRVGGTRILNERSVEGVWSMSPFWKFWPWTHDKHENEVLDSKVHLANADEIYDAGRPWTQEDALAFPRAKIVFDADDINLDCFGLGLHTYVSRNLRHVISQFSSSVRFIDIDDGRSSKSIQEAKFKMLNVTEHASMSAAAIDDGYTGPHIFFADERPGQIYCTLPLAIEIVRSGVRGVAMLHPEFMGFGQMRCLERTGLVEYNGWSEAGGVLVEEYEALNGLL